ncbi:hypothetical protein CH373_01300 [Leptospira perolatii]|uniref:Fumarylacetoacetase-like C-terminal domain-containing protein n=1 Tax=Leptospira perolatii TaxID=2023191 RepID=A0A2M9ZRR9_9LEPT|nr:fumarylacetoacetate hydrolase family protein [Leptospira perolatii]PJZ71182.1 hypothetical protein CH360_01300 [Leptospira perolatii]PJZ74715.1 hypothetical protein CH373_01300 [Leptospira perolatii]
MSLNIVRFRFPKNRSNDIYWGVQSSEFALPLKEKFSELSDFLKNGKESARIVLNDKSSEKIPLSEIEFLSPVTAPCQIFCQGQNYSEHARESGTDPRDRSFNLFFQKATSSLHSPVGEIRRPKGVKLLDYEIELGLVLGTSITEPVSVTWDNLHQYISGIVIGNDVSARDVQIPQGQWFKGKSYRTFCPVGPYLTLLEKDEIQSIPKLRLILSVNGKVRQDSVASKMIYQPPETLSELSQITDLFPGDLILTGTPSGVAMKAPSPTLQRIARVFLKEPKLMEIFVKKQLKISDFLKDGDVMEGRIFDPAGNLDLGSQKLVISS